MRELIIIRHAIALERDPRRWRERERPLSPEGRKRFRTIARRLGGWIPGVDLLLTSPLERAKQTASILTQQAGWPKAKLSEALAPGEEPAVILGQIEKLKASRVAVVGHEPHLSRLIGLCIARDDSAVGLEIKKGGIAIITFPGAVRPGRGTLTALVPPGVLRAKKV